VRADDLIPAAISLPLNPGWRSDSSGRQLRRFRGLSGAEAHYCPEDWLASTVCTRDDKYSQGPTEK
jgi:hypothetical protein